MKRTWIIVLGAVLVPLVSAAQEGGIESSTTVVTGAQQVDVDDDSSKFNEYRDVRDGFYVYDLDFELLDNGKGRYVELDGQNLSREDQTIGLRAGRFGQWELDLDWNEIPHLLSNAAQTPYRDRGRGLLDLPATVPITFTRLNTAAADAANVLAMDELTAAYLDAFLHPVDLGLERDRGTAAFTYTGLERLDVSFAYTAQQRSGSKVGYGPIGDRPPRTLNVQLAEPIDDRTDDLELRLGHRGDRYQLGFTYLASEYENEIDTLTWRNMFANPDPGADFDVWDRAVSVFGRRPLAPDNEMQSAALNFGLDTALAGRLEASASYALLEQDEQLLPYSFATSNLVDAALPRASAEAEMRIADLDLAYSFAPASRVHVRAFYRYHDLDNQTPEDRWWYVTQDTANLNGTRSYKNRRVNLAREYDTQTLGAEAELRLGFWRSTLGLGYRREEIGRAYREADTSEDRLELSWRARPSGALSLRLRALYGDRQAEDYDAFFGQVSYWYAPTDVNDTDNPGFNFTNHPDMRSYDVSDRRRLQADLTASYSSGESYSLSASVRYCDDDFDSEVRPSQPLLGRDLPDAAATTPGDQLGMLDDRRLEVGLDGVFTPSERLSWNVFASFEQADSLQRGLEFNENNRENPSAVANADLGPWTRASSQWTADTADELLAFGLGLDVAVVPERVRFALDATASYGDVDIAYGGFGLVNASGVPNADDYQFAFRTPPTVSHDELRADASLGFQVSQALDLTLGYLFTRYEISDWQQEDATPWFEPVGSEYLLRDTSRSHQWGNRLVNLGSFLAPGYDGHTLYALLGYRF